MHPTRLLTTFVLSLLCFVALPAVAQAGPSASGSLSTKSGAKGSGSGSDYDWPEVVYGGNAISLLVPFQIGAVGYIPKGRFAFQYDRQILKGHWFHIGVGIDFDRARAKNFRMSCGLPAGGRICGPGGVVGFDIYAGYTHKFYVKAKPWVVPFVRGALGYSLFALPRVGEDETLRLQNRTRSQYIALKPGGGFRLFLLPELGLGSEINIPIGVLIHRNVTDDGVGNPVRDTGAGFLLGFEIMAVVVEYRF
jgi:hypothetical protein